MISRIVRFLEGLLDLNHATENLLVDLVAAVSPWIAPVVPAVMVYQNMVSRINFPPWASFVTSLAVETLGISTIQTAVTFWQWNLTKRQLDPKAPMWLAIFVVTIYVSIVMMVNVILDTSELRVQVAKGLLSFMTVCSGLTLAMRVSHARRLMSIKLEKEERKLARQSGTKVAQTNEPLSKTSAPLFRFGGSLFNRREPVTEMPQVAQTNTLQGQKLHPDYRRLSVLDKQNLRGKSASDIRIVYPTMPVKTSQNWVNWLKHDHELELLQEEL